MTVTVTQPTINVREELADLRKPSGIAGEAMLRAETPQEQFQLIGAGRRNILINGDFRISQRGSYTTATSISSETYALDRWANYLSGVGATFQQKDATINGVARKCLRMAATSSASGYFGPIQKVELTNIPVGSMVTMSGYVRTNISNVYFRHDHVGGVTGIQAPNAITADENWQYITWTIDTKGTTTNPIFQVLAYNYGNIAVTSGDYIEIADMQLELGKVATPFEHRSYGEELALCQRYYEKWSGVGHYGAGFFETTGHGKYFLPYKQVKRATPTISIGASASDWVAYWTGTSASATSTGSQNISAEAAMVWVNGGGYGTDGYATTLLGNTSNAFIEIDAEL
tara:strand:- start:659 stop:1690 length:1032 start_codon:yes stop_codon:yes gene_type:complete